MSRGYLVLAQNNSTVDYIRQAYALALSIKNTQTSIRNISICVENKTLVPEKYRKVFHNIIEIPWGDAAEGFEWKIHNKWKYYYMSPYDETVALDTDMLFTTDISHWWEFMAKFDILFTTQVLTYRGELSTGTAYRELFENNDLPNIYTGFFYFQKTKKSAEMFRMVDIIFHNYEFFTTKFLVSKNKPRLSGDVAYALAAKLLGNYSVETTAYRYPTFVHMKSLMQNVSPKYLTDDWPTHFRSYVHENGNIQINNYIQKHPFHYHKDEWLTDDIVGVLENNYDR
jgi:hypothetical protein